MQGLRILKRQSESKNYERGCQLFSLFQETAIGICNWILAIYRKLKFKTLLNSDNETIEAGNQSTHYGNIVIESIMIE